MIFLNNKKDVCDLCGKSCAEAYWTEITDENGEIKDSFLCAECYMKTRKDSQKPCREC